MTTDIGHLGPLCETLKCVNFDTPERGIGKKKRAEIKKKLLTQLPIHEPDNDYESTGDESRDTVNLSVT